MPYNCSERIAVAGLVALAPGAPRTGRGQVNYVTANFEPGSYALLCLVPDAKDRRPHVAHGMIREITVE